MGPNLHFGQNCMALNTSSNKHHFVPEQQIGTKSRNRHACQWTVIFISQIYSFIFLHNFM